MKYFIILTIFVSSLVKADQCTLVTCNDVSKDKRDCVVKEECSPKIRKLKAEIARLQKENEALKVAYTNLRTEHAIVHIENNPPEVVEYKNAVSLLVGASKTSLNTQTNTNNFTARTDYETDLGLMFQRDFTRFRGSFGATINGTLLLGAGFTF